MSSPSLYNPRFPALFKEHPDAIAAILCGFLVFLGWLALNLGWLGLSLLILPAAYVIGGYESAREGLTTLFQEKELDVDLLMIVAALGAAILGLGLGNHNLSGASFFSGCLSPCVDGSNYANPAVRHCQ